MSSESFLPISDDVCSFGEALSRSIFPVPSLHHWCAHRLYTGPTGLIWRFAGVAFPTLAANRYTGANRVEFEISP